MVWGIARGYASHPGEVLAPLDRLRRADACCHEKRRPPRGWAQSPGRHQPESRSSVAERACLRGAGDDASRARSARSVRRRETASRPRMNGRRRFRCGPTRGARCGASGRLAARFPPRSGPAESAPSLPRGARRARGSSASRSNEKQGYRNPGRPGRRTAVAISVATFSPQLNGVTLAGTHEVDSRPNAGTRLLLRGHACWRRRRAARPTRPEARRRAVEGSGTCATMSSSTCALVLGV